MQFKIYHVLAVNIGGCILINSVDNSKDVFLKQPNMIKQKEVFSSNKTQPKIIKVRVTIDCGFVCNLIATLTIIII